MTVTISPISLVKLFIYYYYSRVRFINNAYISFCDVYFDIENYENP
jgi:hypothetical protein